MLKYLPPSIATTLLALSFASLSLAQGPNPDLVHITAITYEGSGCPQGSVGTSFASNRQSFTLIFDQLVASTGPGVPSTEAKKDCALTLLLNIPTSFQGGAIDFAYRGYTQLGAGLTAGHKRKYSSSKTSANTSLVGTTSRDYLFTDPVAFTKVKSCDGTPCLVAKLKLSVEKSDSVNQQLTIDSIDGGVTISN